MPQDSTPDPRKSGPSAPFPAQKQSFPGSEAVMDPAPDYGAESYKGHHLLAGKVALITGGDSGIGRAVALAYAREGADVAFAYLNEHEDAAKTQAIIEAEGRRALRIDGDLADPKTCERIIASTVQTFGRIDILVNNAASQREALSGIEDLDDARVRDTFAVNIVAMFALVRLALPHMRPGGSIINVSSIQAYKGAIVAFTKGLAQELGPKGIRANSVAPGPIWTPLIQQSFPKEKIAHFGEGDPLGRPGQPADVAPSFVFLASDAARYINGEILGVTGGGLLA
jgi:NAD(P)-dependent dehydrogenase (short-subunit alcohol dehydrogenase family)